MTDIDETTDGRKGPRYDIKGIILAKAYAANPDVVIEAISEARKQLYTDGQKAKVGQLLLIRENLENPVEEGEAVEEVTEVRKPKKKKTA